MEGLTIQTCLLLCAHIVHPGKEHVFRVLFPGCTFAEFMHRERKAQWQDTFPTYRFEDIMEHRMAQCASRKVRFEALARHHMAKTGKQGHLPANMGWYDWDKVMPRKWMQETHFELDELATTDFEAAFPGILRNTKTVSYEQFVEYFLSFGQNSKNCRDLSRVVEACHNEKHATSTC